VYISVKRKVILSPKEACTQINQLLLGFHELKRKKD